MSRMDNMLNTAIKQREINTNQVYVLANRSLRKDLTEKQHRKIYHKSIEQLGEQTKTFKEIQQEYNH